MESKAVWRGSGASSQGRLLLAAFAGALLAAILWAHLVDTPFWLDDYMKLNQARLEVSEGSGLSRAVFREERGYLWRPLTQGICWRFFHGVLDGNPVTIHFFNLIVLLTGVTLVGWSAATLAALRHTSIPPRLAAFVAALLYGSHSVFFLPAAWASGVEELMALLWTAVALRLWIELLRPGGIRWLGYLVPLAYCLALLSKEGTLVFPALALSLVPLTRRRFQDLGSAWAVMALCGIVALLWYVIRSQFVAPPSPESPYSLQIGLNVPRNGVALIAFIFNVSREVFRFAAEGSPLLPATWGALTMVLHAAGFLCLWASYRRRSRRADHLALLAFTAAGLAFYLLPVWNCYPYYTVTALIAFALFVAFSAERSRRFAIGCGLVLAASLVSIAGEHLAPYPATLAKARWVGETMDQFPDRFVEITLGEQPTAIHVLPADARAFIAIGATDGIACVLLHDSAEIRLWAPDRDQATLGQDEALIIVRDRLITIRYEGRTVEF